MAKLIYFDPFIKTLQVHTRVPKEVQPYKFKTKRTARVESIFTRPTSPPEEILTGYVHGEKASALEERFAKALDFFGITYKFQFEVTSVYSLPGEEKTIDFLVFDGGIAFPVEIGSKFVHDSPSKKEEERYRVGLINDVLPMLGIMPISEEPFPLGSYIPFDQPESFEQAKDIVAAMFISI